MPRKEGPPLEERMQRAKELFELKQKRKAENLRELYNSHIYKYARKTSIAFLWITQLILIDWALPYNKEYDKVSGSNFNAVIRPNQELFITTAKGYLLKVEFPKSSSRPAPNDSLVIYKSLLLHDVKKLSAPAVKETYLVATAVTYRFLPFLLITATLALAFVFVQNIEVRVFAWIVSVFTTIGDVFFLYYIISAFQ